MEMIAHSASEENGPFERTALGNFVSAPPQIVEEQSPAEEAIAFLKTIDAAGRHNLVRMCPDENHPPEGRTFEPGAWGKIEDFIETWDGSENLYFSVNEPSPNAPHKKLEAGDIGAVRAIVADVDLPGANTDEELSALWLTISTKLRAGPTPTAVIDSGGGVQATWVLEEKVPVERATKELVQAHGRGVQVVLGGDAVHDLPRIMRLPGPMNIPTAAKRAKGRLPRRARTLATNSETVSLVALATAYPPMAGPQERPDDDARVAAVQLELTEARSYGSLDYSEIDLQTRQAFETLCQRDPALAALWLGEPPKSGDSSGSGYRAALAHALGRSGQFGAVQFAELCGAWDFAVQAGDDRENKLTARALARDWVHIGEPATPQNAIDRWFEPPAVASTGEAAADVPFDFDQATRVTAADLDNIPAREFVLGTRFQPGVLTLGSGPAGVSKSAFALFSALAIATGKPLTGEAVSRPGAVLIYNAEDPLFEMRSRLLAISQFHRLDLETVIRRVRLLSGYDTRRLAFAMREGKGSIGPGADIGALTAFVRAQGIVHVVLDPLVSLHRGLEENSAGDMEALGDNLRRFAQATGASIDLIHHTVKNKAGNSEQNAGVADAARGSGAVMGFVRGAYTLAPMNKTSGEELNLPADRWGQMVRLDDSKRNYARRSSREKWFELKSVLTSGEVVSPSDFQSSDREAVRRANASVVVHAPFDHVRQRALAAMSRADADEVQTDELRRFVASNISEGRIGRSEMVDCLVASLGMGATTARNKLDTVIPPLRTQAVSIDVDGTGFRLWREQVTLRGARKWMILCEQTGQSVRSRPANEDDDEVEGGIFS